MGLRTTNLRTAHNQIAKMFRIAIRSKYVLYTQTILAIVCVCGHFIYHGHGPLWMQRKYEVISAVAYLPFLWLMFECLLDIYAPTATRIPSWKWFIILFSSFLLALIINVSVMVDYVRG
jgi:hypothetical protein